MKAKFLLPSLGCLFISNFGMQSLFGSDIKLDSDQKKGGYAIGKQIGQSLKSQGVDVDSTALKAAIDDTIAGKPLAQNDDESRSAMMAIEQKIRAKQEEAGKENLVKGKKYLEEFTAKYAKEADGSKRVQALPSGLLYRVLTKGSGKESPTLASNVKVHYAGRLIDGSEFDSSYKRGSPAEFPVSGVIKGWTEILQKMHVGDKYEVAIPSELAYGPAGSPPRIPGNSVLVFEMELLGIEQPKAPAKNKNLDDLSVIPRPVGPLGITFGSLSGHDKNAYSKYELF